MRRMKMMGLCLVALFALTAVAVSSASAAEPAFYECHKLSKNATTKKYEGKYSEKKCSKEASPTEQAEGKKNKYELQEGIGSKGKGFKGKGGKATLHTPAVGGEVTCKSFGDVGKVATPTTESGVISEFKTCESLGKKCASPGEKAGTIKTNSLKGVLGYINKGAKTVGVALSPESGSVLAEFNCEGLEIVTSGSVIGTIAPVNVFTKAEFNVFAVNGEGFQSIKKFEGGSNQELVSSINGSPPLASGQQAEAENKGEELEIKA
ncbi:MAG TPA: hypothetical protein VH081_05630 [Solirubrobacteraceae bacterium]|jgi:hypothetical protein|nr:hypothetical protein [Solirubrobacteraceae bacterium]